MVFNGSTRGLGPRGQGSNPCILTKLSRCGEAEFSPTLDVGDRRFKSYHPDQAL